MAKPVIINHAGRRDGYQLALAFAKANLLQSLITDFYINLDSILLKPFRKVSLLNKRYQSGVPGNKVKTPLGAIGNSLRNAFAHDPELLYKKDSILSMAAYDEAVSSNANLFLYSYTAYEAFYNAKLHKVPLQRFLFQMHPSPDYIRQILTRELERYPFAEASLRFENEMKEDHITERLRAEPMMADYIFVASTFTKQSLESTGILPEKIIVTPYGVDATHFPYFKHNHAKTQFKILYVGQLIQRKGIADLLSAIQNLHTKQITLTICTRGFFDEHLLKSYAGLNITIRKNASHAELIEELHSADLFVLPSLAEGFGFVILEAMHSGLPVMTTCNTAGLDIIEDGVNGFLVKPAHPEELAEKIEYAVSHRHLLEEIGYRGHQKAATYTWEKFRSTVVENYLALAQ